MPPYTLSSNMDFSRSNADRFFNPFPSGKLGELQYEHMCMMPDYIWGNKDPVTESANCNFSKDDSTPPFTFSSIWTQFVELC